MLARVAEDNAAVLLPRAMRHSLSKGHTLILKSSWWNNGHTVMSSWAEIRRLQAALDEVQASSTSHKLSERNCIEVVSKLVEMGLVSVLYTLDGK